MFSKWFPKQKTQDTGVPQPAPESIPESPEPKAPYLTETVVFGMHRYRTAGEDSSVFFVDESRNIRKMLVDSKGRIQNFPGIVKEDFWVGEVSANALKPQIRFRTSFEKRENGWILLWQIQPDGWYWADEDGFGAEKDLEVTLFTYVDRNGDFTAPFRLYCLGNTCFAMDRFTSRHAGSQTNTLKMIREGSGHGRLDEDIFPQLMRPDSRYAGNRTYQIRNREEAEEYWKDPVLAEDLMQLAGELLASDKDLWAMFGNDYKRIKGCMTLFWLISGEPVFKQILDKFFDGQPDEYTLTKIGQEGT